MNEPSKLVAAECPACGARRFRASGESPDPADVLSCESCGLKLSYAFLQNRMTEARAPEPAPRRAKRAKRARKTARKRPRA